MRMLGKGWRSMLRGYKGACGKILLKWGAAVLRPYGVMEKTVTGVPCPYGEAEKDCTH